MEITDLATLSSIWTALRLGVEADVMQYSPASVAMRTMRRLPAVGAGRKVARLLASPWLVGHAAAQEHGDPLFCLSHRGYLARGLSRTDRLDAALCHYERVDAMLTPAFRAGLGGATGISLWRRDAGLHVYDLRLTMGRDVAYEGGLSVTLHIDDGPLAVLSFSLVPTRILRLDQPAAGPVIPLITRKHTSNNRDARAAFDRDFDRCNPGGLTVAGLAALAARLGYPQVVGLAAERHLSWTEAHAQPFANSYDVFWQSLGAARSGPFGYMIDLPVRYTPLEGMTSARRARALRRRQHLQTVGAAADQTLARLAG